MRVTYRDIINRSTKYNVTRSARSSMVRKMTPFTMLPSSSTGAQARVRAACAGALHTTAGEWPFNPMNEFLSEPLDTERS